MAAAAVVGGLDEDGDDAGRAARTYDRIVRIVGWVFILADDVIVGGVRAVGRPTRPAILALLALAGLFMLVVHDLLPSNALGPAKFVVEGSVAVTVATLLVALTGGVASPFFFTYPLIVGGAALVVSPAITVALTGDGLARLRPGRRCSARRPGSTHLGRRRDGRHQPDRADPAGLRRDGHRPRAAPDARRRGPPVDHRPADRPVQPRLLLRRPRARDRPQRPVQPRASAC